MKSLFCEHECAELMNKNKLIRLIEILKEMGSAVLAYSGGVDSVFLLKALQLSGIRTLAVTSLSEVTIQKDMLIADKMAQQLGMEQRFVEINLLSSEDFAVNPPERCFFCKDMLFGELKRINSDAKYSFIIDGSQADDTSDYRPGQMAAAKHGIRSPLKEAGLSKGEIRILSRDLGLSTWDRNTSTCLATRIPYGQRITLTALERIKKAEEFLESLGYEEVRVRDHGDLARIEIPVDAIESTLTIERRALILEILRSFGYSFISVDLDGYKSGNLNRVLKK